MMDKIGDLLLEAGIITQAQLTSALDYQKTLGGKLGTILIKLGFVKEKELLDFLSRQLRLPVAPDEEIRVNEELLGLLPREFLAKHEMLPIRREDDLLVVATAEPTDYPVIDEITFLTNLKVETVLAARAKVQAALHAFLSRTPSGRLVAGPRRARDVNVVKAQVRPVERQALRSAQAASLGSADGEVLARALCALLIDKGVVKAEELAERVAQEERR